MRFDPGSTLRIGLAPAALELTALDWRGRVAQSSRFALEGEAGGWKAAAAGLRAQCKGGRWKGRAAEIVLSSHFVRYCLLPAELRSSGAAERATYVRHVFRAEYGETVNGWRIATDEGARGQRLACAIEEALFDELGVICREGGLRLRAVMPHLAAAANAGRALIREPAAWLMMLEDRLCIAGLLEEGRWRHVARLRLADASGAGLLKALHEQEVLRGGGRAARHLYVGGVARDAFQGTDTGGWNIAFLPAGAMPARAAAGRLAA